MVRVICADGVIVMSGGAPGAVAHRLQLTAHSSQLGTASLHDIDVARTRIWTASLAVVGAGLGGLLAILRHAHGVGTVAWIGGGALVAGVAARAGIGALGASAGRVAGRIFMPSGASSPAAPDYSYQDSLVARGAVDAALRSYDALIAEGESAALLLRVADLCTRPGGDRTRALALFRRARELPGCSSEQDVYATNRLVDLHLAASAESGRALVELRRLADRHAGTREGARARDAIARLKREMEGR